ncbi:glycosyltransferase family 2 protein [Candidatus Contubernalis alkaliaceticus]|uniref:glycosyltransferase family 2 protein n=1 Tax=Candidatus Contubernalis alkaliaceticus TaxID=338645 RepID=UPI001F4C2089|nr:glycosyltransferase family A protein [Candidatus Contubernalis alkalaceticus]UNC93581.1 glycosyltransferase family 2 protein [Candidatus Contubernalis alkalaceticus]
MKPYVSIIIPTRNRAQLLKTSLKSVQAQTYKNYEVLVVDDCSTDGTLDVVKNYQKQGMDIVYVKHLSPRGGAAARNTAIKRSSGSMTAFLDDDDLWLPEKLEKQVKLLTDSRSETAAVYTGLRFCGESDNIIKDVLPEIRGNIFERLLEKNYIGTLSSVLLRKEALFEVGGFDESLPSKQDLDLYLRISQKYEFDYIKEILVIYRKHHQGRISDNIHSKIEGHHKIYNKYYASFKKNRRGHSFYLMNYGRKLLEFNLIKEARKNFFKAFLIYPANLETLPYFTLLSLGEKNYKRLKSLRPGKNP